MAYLDRIAACRTYHPENYVPFRVGGQAVGFVAKAFLGNLDGYGCVLAVTQDGVTLDPGLADPASRTAALDEVLRDLKGRGLIPGWRGERYAVREKWGRPVLMEMERAAVPLFGVEGYGVHMNGFVRDGDDLKMWIGKRSLTKPTGPGKLDQVVAGGLPADIGIVDNLIKECGEEAAIPPELARKARPVGAVTYCTERAEGLRRDVLFNFDLEMPAGFEPRNTDGEIDGFFLWSMDDVMARVRDTDDFKFNCAVIVIDFLVRRGFIGPDDRDYVDIQQGLHRAEGPVTA